ncbi:MULTISPECIES: type II secretion system protein GspM [Paraburkholderia]|uniref:Type II secretion system protein M n=1 Tax=Paraburkholderia podalyriae TaxID=1938811 RepID=A0ABR7PWT4_9BURK|nr:type II secretion system protein M [Paraburkholderia podalyriae]MBC8750755.1 type II secretion system protein M [Paraburkholderia podalyriae]
MDGQIRAVRAALTEWFEVRAPREKKLLLVGGVLVALALVYNVLWEPAYDGRAQIVAKLPLLEAQLADVQLQIDEARRLKAAAAVRPPAGIALREALGASLAQAGVAKAQLTVLGKGVQVDAKAVSFAVWMAWLDQVRREQHVRVINAHASAEAKQGQATVSATLQPAADQ